MTKSATVQEMLDARLPEAQFQREVVRLAESLGWVCWHPTISVWSKGGWPDLVLLRPPEALFWELKKQNGKTTPAQDAMLDLLRRCGFEVAVLRPSDRAWIQQRLLGRRKA